MFLQKIVPTLILLNVLLVSMLGALFLAPLEVSARLISPVTEESDSLETKTCPIEGSVWASFKNNEGNLYVEDVFYNEIELTNNSAYTFGGVRLGVGVYKSSLDTVPAYWTILPEEYLLLPNLPLSIAAEIDLSILPAGEYTIKVFSMQGDETALLGAILRDVEQTEGVTIVKSTPKKSDVSVSVTVNNQLYNGQAITLEGREPISVQIKTKNGNSLPLLGSSMLGVITQGEVPLGTAVRVDKLDGVKLIPGGTRATDLNDRFVEGGKYSVYAGLVNPNILSPLVKVKVVASESEYEGSWSYISKVGLSSYPLQVDSEVVACVNNIGANEDREQFTEPLGVEVILTAKTGESFTKKMNSIEAGTGNYFYFNPQIQVSDFDLTLNFLQKRFSAEVVEGNDYSKETVTDELSIVDTTTLSFVCIEGESCVETIVASASVNSTNDGLPQKPFLFYAAITIAAALLLFIMLRRLPPEDVITRKGVSSNELQ